MSEDDLSTTRICIKNVPKHVDEKRLKEHFSSKGQVTDAKLLRTKTGEPRRMAFIGFRTGDEAKKAMSFFNNTFLDTSRLIVEPAMPRGASTLPRPWSKYSKGSSRFDDGEEKQGGKRKHDERSGDDEEGGGMQGAGDGGNKEEKANSKKRRVVKEEFLATMMPRTRTKFWANDDNAGASAAVTNGDEAEASSGRIRGAAAAADDDGDDQESVNASEEEDREEKKAGPVAKKPPTSDLDYLRSKVKKGLDEEIEGGNKGKQQQTEEEEDDDDDDDEGSSEEEEQEKEEEEEGVRKAPPKKGSDQSSAKANEEEEEGNAEAKETEEDQEKEGGGGADETGRVFLRNLPFATTEEDLMEELEQYGQVSELHIPLDDTRRPKGFAFVTYILPQDAQKAMAALNGKAFQGRLLHVIPAKEPPKDPLADLDLSKARTYKERKEIERRQRAGDDRGWNASFMRSETVVDAVADRLNIQKGAVLDREGDGMAVKLALGETFLLAENREFFKKEGVDLSTLEGARGGSNKGSSGGDATARSKTTLLVKNLPYSTTQEDLTKLFGKFGLLSRVLLSPSRSIGLVDFLEAADARRAFKGLAYKRFQHVPLYLEWAPLNVISKKAPSSSAETSATAATTSSSTSNGDAKANATVPTESSSSSLAANTKESVAEVKEAPTITTPAAVDEAAEDLEGSFTLFVKNLNFATTEDGLSKAFKQRTKGVRALAIPRKAASVKKKQASSCLSQQQTTPLSMGYGFVEYSTVAQAKEALRTMDGTLLDGYKLQCKLSAKRLTSRSSSLSTSSNKNKTKLAVRNVAFQATVKELKELFGSFGKLKTVRIPKKFDGSHRGFAFVEFLTAQEALNAYQALSATHLYGRHLVIEWAEDKEDLETLREKAAKDVRGGARGLRGGDSGGEGGKKRKVGDEEGFDGDEDF